MAVFLINICKFNGCGITFPSLGDLIQHIEDTHIDYDPKVVEQKEQAQPACLPLSYVLRFITDAARKESPFLGSTGVELKRKLAIKHHSYSMSSSNRSNTPTGSELDEDEMVVSESEDSNDSWTTEEFSSEFIMRYGSRHSGSSNGTQGNEKPFACPVPGCKKRYKNVNGIKYHSKNGHKKDGKVRKGYKCHCGKSYKTAQGLKSHALVAHNASPDSVTNVAVRSTSPSQSLGSLSPSSISNMSNSNGSVNGLCHTQQQSAPNLTSPSLPNHNSNNTANNILRNNIGLISIKTAKSANLIAANVTANKILKLAATSAAAASNLDNGGGHQSNVENGNANRLPTVANTSTAKISLPSLVNLGILTPATSPNKPHTTFQTNSNSNQQGSNNNNLDNLPLTPISPNLQAKNVAVTNSNGITINSNNTNGSGGGCIGGGTLTIANVANGNNNSSGAATVPGMHLSSHGGGNSEHPSGEET